MWEMWEEERGVGGWGGGGAQGQKGIIAQDSESFLDLTKRISVTKWN
jgi:hypothetical protein